MHLSHALAVSAAFTCCTLPAFADFAPPLGPSPSVWMEPFAVTDTRLRAETVPGLATARTDLARIAGGVETIATERFRRGRASTVDDTFALSPGLIAQSRFGADEARMSIRGSGLQRTFHGRGVRVLQDGVPLNLADGGFDMQALDPLAASYINVWRGGHAPGTGASTLGGAIDYVSHTGHTASGARARLEVGSWDYLRAGAAGGAASGPFDGFATFSHHAQSGFREHAHQSSQRLFSNAGYRVNDALETRVFLTGVLTDSELPGNLTREQLERDPRAAAAGNRALDQKRDYHLLRLASKTTGHVGALTWNATAAWSFKDLDHPIFQVIDQRSHDVLLGFDLQQAPTPGSDHRWQAGLIFTRGRTESQNFVNQAGRRGPRVSAADQTATNLEGFFGYEAPFSRRGWLLAGLTGALNRRDNDPVAGAVPDYTVSYSRWMPRLGVRWDFGAVQVFGSVSTSYEPPSFSEALTLNTARDAQTAVTGEIGTRGEHGAWRWDVTLYHAALRRELLALDHDANPATPAVVMNADETVHSGIEAAGELDLLGQAWGDATITRRLVARMAWTYGRFRFADDPRYGDNILAGLPPHVVRGEVMWEHSRGWYVGPTFTWVPEKTFIDFRNTFAARPHTLLGFRFGRRQAGGFSWFVDARNLADERHAATTGVIEAADGRDQPQFLPGDGRSWFAGIEYGW